jgi:hypothetical protein
VSLCVVVEVADVSAMLLEKRKTPGLSARECSRRRRYAADAAT